ncbi:MAG: hypothetical protein RQ842_08700, partial [Vulcanisaeta sp.]|nr:hypothetical protein [Vulcanisaeta sp.]
MPRGKPREEVTPIIVIIGCSTAVVCRLCLCPNGGWACAWRVGGPCSCTGVYSLSPAVCCSVWHVP